MANYRKSFNFRNGVQVDDDNFIVNPNGLVGIGTSVPTEFLDVRGTAKVVGLATIKSVWAENAFVSGASTVSSRLTVGILSVSNGIVTATSTSGIVTYYGDGGKLSNLPTSQWIDVDPGFGYTSIYSAGNVGIATTYPNFALQIGGNPSNSQQGIGINSTGNIYATGILTARQIQLVGNNAGITGVTSIIASTTEPLLRVTQLGSGLALLVEDSGSPDSSPFAIDSSGRGFIGTTGDASAIDGITFFNSYARFISTITGNAATDGMLIGEGPLDNGYQNIYSYDRPLKVETNGTKNHITLIPSSTSNIGVGTTNPTSKFTVSGDALITGVTTVTELKASISTTGISTVTEYLHVGTGGTIFTVSNTVKLGIGTNDPTAEIQIIKPTSTSIEVITGNVATVSVGQSVGVGRSSAYFRYGSPAKSLSIGNNDLGDFVSIIHGGLPGIGTGAWKWVYGQTNSEKMSLTYDGKLGLGIVNPVNTLHVVGTSTVTNTAWFGGNVNVVGIVSAATIVVSNLNVSSPTLDNVNINVSSGISTFKNIRVTNSVSIASSIGIGTDNPRYDIDAASKALLIGSVGINTDPQYFNTVASGSLSVGGQINCGSIGIGTTSAAYLQNTSGEYVAVYGPFGVFNSEIRAYRGSILGDINSIIAIGTHIAECSVDFSKAGSGPALNGNTGNFLRFPHATRSQRVGFLTGTGGVFWNTTDSAYEAWNGTEWINLGITTASLRSDQINVSGVATITQAILSAGTNTAAPLKFISGSNLTTPVAGAIEYDGTYLYSTPETTSGRGHLPTERTFRLTSNGSAIGAAIADYFATGAISLAASSVYNIEIHAYFTKTTAGTATWTLTASSAPTLISGHYTATPVTGVGAGAPTTGFTASEASTTAAFAATGTLTTAVNHSYIFKIQVITNLATTFKLRLTQSAGTATPLSGSYYTVKRISGTTGTFS